jgi:alanine racemase
VINIATKNKAIVDLKAILNNAEKIKKITGNYVKLCGVVKADAYGHGAIAVANALYSVCNCFAVALTAEGVALRQGGIDKEILLLTPIKKDEEQAVRYNLILTVSCISHIRDIEYICKRLNMHAVVHIKYNSGMNRLGCNYNELQKLISIILKSKYVDLQGIYSHFYMPQNNEELEKQYLSFLKAQNYAKCCKTDIISHISASGGILAGRKYDFDMVRAGIMLYGYKPYKSEKLQLKKALKIKADIIENKKIGCGENLLYGDYKLKKNTEVSLVRLGYADGFLRCGTQNNYNNLCMDISAEKVLNNKKIIITDFDKLAKEYNTISYEVLCSVTKRSEMVYK